MNATVDGIGAVTEITAATILAAGVDLLYRLHQLLVTRNARRESECRSGYLLTYADDRFRLSPPKTTTAPPANTQPPQGTAQPTAAQNEDTEMQLDLAPSPPPIEDIIAQRRARRQAILAKHAAAAPQPDSPALSVSGLTLGAGSNGAPPTPIPAHVVQEVQATRAISDTPEPTGNQSAREASPATDNGESKRITLFHSQTCYIYLGQATPTSSAGMFSLTKTNDPAASLGLTIDTNGTTAEDGTTAQVSAAEYDPTLDWREDQARRAAHRDQTELADGIGERDERGGTAIGQDPYHAEEGADGEDEEEDLDDMFAVGSRKIKLTPSVSDSHVVLRVGY